MYCWYLLNHCWYLLGREKQMQEIYIEVYLFPFS